MRLLPTFLTALSFLPAATLPADFQQQTLQWQSEREAKLKADDGWLTVAGLFWLKEGTNTVGTAAGSDVLLPGGPDAARVAILERRGTSVTLRPEAPGLRVNGQPASAQALRSDENGAATPDLVTWKDLTFFVVPRGSRVGVRMRDKNSKFRQGFTGLRWFPPNPSYRVEANYVPYPAPRKVKIDTVIGEPEEMQAPGHVVFTLGGKQQRLEPVLAEGGRLWFIFRDLTSRTQTYGGGRFLYADPPKDGKVTLDFNRAYNPPCSFTPYATCPLPPRQNRLAIEIPAGEQRYH